jgi:hypothetical protein
VNQQEQSIDLINKGLYVKSYYIASVLGIYSCNKISHPHRFFVLSVLQTSYVKRIKISDATYFHKDEAIKYMDKYINKLKLGKNTINHDNHIWSINIIRE